MPLFMINLLAIGQSSIISHVRKYICDHTVTKYRFKLEDEVDQEEVNQTVYQEEMVELAQQ